MHFLVSGHAVFEIGERQRVASLRQRLGNQLLRREPPLLHRRPGPPTPDAAGHQHVGPEERELIFSRAASAAADRSDWPRNGLQPDERPALSQPCQASSHSIRVECGQRLAGSDRPRHAQANLIEVCRQAQSGGVSPGVDRARIFDSSVCC